MQEQRVTGALIDTYSAGDSKEMFAKQHFRVNKILDYSSTYGIVMGKEARKLRICFKEYSEQAFASEISHHIQKNTVKGNKNFDFLLVKKCFHRVLNNIL